MATSRTKYFYPPRPGNGAGTFSDNIVGLQTVNFAASGAYTIIADFRKHSEDYSTVNRT